MKINGKILNKYRSMSKQMKVVFWFTFVGFLQRGISVITTPIFTRVLSTDDYGLFSVFNAYSTVLVIVVTLYLHMGVIHNALVKNPDSNERVVSAFQSLSMVTSLFWLGLAILFREQLASLMGLPELVVVMMFVGFVFYEPYNLWIIYKRYQYDYVRPVALSVVVSILTPIVSVIAIMLTPGNQGVARIMAYVSVNAILPGCIMYISSYRKDHTFFDGTLWKYALSFNLPLLVHYLSETLLNQTDRIMINAFLGTSEAGIYSVAYSAASLFTIFSSALNTAFVPWSFQKLQSKEYRAMERMGYLVLGFLAVILSVMIMFAPEIIYVLAGSKYTGAVYLIPTLSASVFFGYMYQLFSRIELYYEKKSYTVISTVTAAAVNILLNAWWIPRFGFTAAGYSTLLSHILFCVMHYFFFRKVSRECMNSEKIYDVKKLAAISLAVLIVTFAMTILYDYLVLRLVIVAVIFAAVFVLRHRIANIIKILGNKQERNE